MSYFLAFAGFAALIILHEFGHFVAAKAVGMRVERFALFFPPLIARFRPKGSETEYGIGLIPLGGYVKITGMNPAEDIPPEVLPRAYFRQPVWKRVVVISAGPAVNIVLAFLILWVLFTVRDLNFVQPQVDSVQPGTPAAQVLRSGDRIVTVDGEPGYEPGARAENLADRVDALRQAIARHHCAGQPRAGCRATTPVRLTVLRGERRLALTVVPRYDTKVEPPRLLIGFSFASRTVDYGPLGAARFSVKTLADITTKTVDSIVKLFYDRQARKEVSGVVGSYEATRQAFNFGVAEAAYLLAIISLSLGVINLFPFLPLDGGHIFWAVAEKVRGRPIPFSVMEKMGIVGFMLVIFLFYIGLSNDIGRLTSGEGFGVR